MMILIWQLLYPIITYNLIAEACFFFLELEDPLLIQGIAAAAATCLLLPFYLGRRKRMERNLGDGGEQPGRGRPADVSGGLSGEYGLSVYRGKMVYENDGFKRRGGGGLFGAGKAP